MHIVKKNSVVKCVFVGLLLALLVFSGCSTESTTTTATDTVTVTQTTSMTSTTISTKVVVPVELSVSVAASLTDAITSVNEAYMKANDSVTLVTNFASSGTLQKQIEQGAPADVFISAAAKQMNALQDGGIIIDETRRDLLNNKVVLVVPSNSTLGITSFMDLLNDDVKQIALGDPEFVPAGTYGKQALDLLGIYEKVQDKLILGSDVRQVLGYVEAGNVDAGIVYSTDAAITGGVKIVADAPAEINSMIVYPIAVIKDSKNIEDAKAYIIFLLGSEAGGIFEKYGFAVVNK